ncbi:MAG: carbon storage regulator [Planctomycetaceae bacterium]|nr:carbon storage regulator [Planctomycetales bacterium]MCB9922969.1 carbon storage regulator [Planctomycetaceae bacterium]
MLTFTRKNGQSVVVQVAGHAPLTITFMGSRPGKCQLAFEGPQEYRILREELKLRESVPAGPSFESQPPICATTSARITTGFGS